MGSECSGTVEWRLIDLSSAVIFPDGAPDAPPSPMTSLPSAGSGSGPHFAGTPARPSDGDGPRVAQKFSTAYCPPELFEIGADGDCYFRGENAAHCLTKSFDVWAFGAPASPQLPAPFPSPGLFTFHCFAARALGFTCASCRSLRNAGVVLYRLCNARGEPLWKEDRSDNVVDADRADLFRRADGVADRRCHHSALVFTLRNASSTC